MFDFLRYVWTFLHPHWWREEGRELMCCGMGTEWFTLHKCRLCDARASWNGKDKWAFTMDSRWPRRRARREV